MKLRKKDTFTNIAVPSLLSEWLDSPQEQHNTIFNIHITFRKIRIKWNKDKKIHYLMNFKSPARLLL